MSSALALDIRKHVLGTSRAPGASQHTEGTEVNNTKPYLSSCEPNLTEKNKTEPKDFPSHFSIQGTSWPSLDSSSVPTEGIT